ncbi:hypothetical protein C0991_007370 [Blastosporella zonata]|nr:hypothetical protein C0991_007370 [Blastosporella zonata]
MPIASPILEADIDRNTLLCFACSSSLPPPKKSPPGSGTSTPGVFTTPCCQRLICPNCIEANPRLQRYNPCLACLGGVGVVRSLGSTPRLGTGSNLDGAVRDEDVFVLGDEDNSDYEDEKEGDLTLVPDTSSPAQDNHVRAALQTKGLTTGPPEGETPAVAVFESEPSLLKYHIAQSDTLQSIVLRSPHLLHTRRYLILPSSAHKAGVLVNEETPEQSAAWEASRRKERAEKRLQTLTKEVDWRVAKAYVALADDPVEEVEEQEDWERKMKESGSGSGSRPSNLEERAIRRYLDDDEWEENQRRGRLDANEKGEGNNRRWW